MCLRYLSIMGIMLLGACAKYDEVPAVDNFNVSVNKQTVRINDSVIFAFNTGPDMIVFYSGEPGRNYANINRTSAVSGINKLVFQSSMQQGILPSNDSIRLLISSNLRGYDSTSVLNANWVDITSRNTRWPTALSTAFTTSDSVDISDFSNADSVNLAFRILGKQYPTAAQRRWQIQNLTLSNRLPDGTVVPLFAAPFAGANVTSSFQYTGWVQVSIKNNTNPGFNAWNVGTGGISTLDSVRNSNGIAIRTAYPIQFDPGTTVNNPENDDWLITTRTSLKSVRPDVGLIIKNEVNGGFPGMNYIFNREPGVFAKYLYIFRTPGTYLVTFVAQNVNGEKRTEVVRQVQVTVTP
jgi:hypothetical protein